MLFHERLYNYSDTHSYSMPVYLDQFDREAGLTTVNPFMSCGPVMGRWLIQISEWIQPKHILEIGTFTGYSALCLAQGLQSDGIITCLEVNEEYESIIRKYFAIAEKSNQLNLIIGDAIDTLDQLIDQYDLVFIDANKQIYEVLYEKVVTKMSTGGIILIDNVLWYGNVLSEHMDKETQAIHAFNRHVHHDPRVKSFILPIRDGITLIKKL
ncbi:MAG: class I SAM-dependent methyltransferase [Saprospiraceae bacterium]|nr:class I SAM-dependent methyltransferase [Saprospiraceae bacterium]